jgi:acyl-CoA thioesterase-1
LTAASYNTIIQQSCLARHGVYVQISDLSLHADLRGPAGRANFRGPGDDFHPNGAGHAAIAQAIYDQLVPILDGANP